MLEISIQKRFKKDVLLMKKRKKNTKLLQEIIDLLLSEKKLDQKYKDHSLVGDYVDCRECHIDSDWLLIYRLTSTKLILVRTGSHSDLF